MQTLVVSQQSDSLEPVFAAIIRPGTFQHTALDFLWFPWMPAFNAKNSSIEQNKKINFRINS